MEIVRDWGPRTGSPLKGSLVNSLMKATTDESRSGKPDKKRMVPRVNAPLLECGTLFSFKNIRGWPKEGILMDLQAQLEELKSSTQAKLAEMRGNNAKELQELRVQVLGKKGSLTEL